MGSLQKPHVVCIPFPAQGHINPMLKLAKILHSKGFHITFVNTEFNHRRLLKSRGPNSLNGLSSFRFETIPDGLPPMETEATQDIPSLCKSTTETSLVPFKNLILKLNASSSPVSCIVSDLVMSFTIEAAEELGIPEFLLWTGGAGSLLCYDRYPILVEKGLMPLKDADDFTNGYMDRVIDFIPNLKGIRLKDIPSFIRTTNPGDEFMVNFAKVEIARSKRASGIIYNTFQELEPEILDALSSIFPPLLPIGPLNLLHNQCADKSLESIASNLWKEEPECLKWLDSKEPESVVYVNFGSITVMSPEQMVEFCWGLAKSNQTFLWIIRPDLVSGDSAVLPPEFLAETKERGLLASWCPQEQVLYHPSIGGFLTHSGWNSTIESISGGVPMICWPFSADQQTNSWMTCSKWEIGMEINSDVKRDECGRLVRELIVGEKGKEMRKKAIHYKKKAKEACESPLGSSYVNLENLIHQLHQQNFSTWYHPLQLNMNSQHKVASLPPPCNQFKRK